MLVDWILQGKTILMIATIDIVEAIQLPAVNLLSASVALSSAVSSLLSVSPDLLSTSLARSSASCALLSASVTRLDSTEEDDNYNNDNYN